MQKITALVLACCLLVITAPAQQIIAGTDHSTRILTGADRMECYLPLLKGASVAVFANQTSRVGNTHLVDTLLKKGIHVVRIFSPEHGFRGEADAGEHVGSSVDAATGIPVISLYGQKSKPSAADLAGVDILLFDIQDVGVRFYTYISSFQKFLECAIENQRPLILLDRPNPNGFYVDGPVLDPAFHSFVGMQPIPTVYGMTLGEYANLLIGRHWLDSAISRFLQPTPELLLAGTDGLLHPLSGTDGLLHPPAGKNHAAAIAGLPGSRFSLVIIPCLNYTHHSRYILPVKPSPNLPNMQAVYLYPSLCLFEGTAVSLGRGTDKPFQQFGYPGFPDSLYPFTPTSMPGARTPPLMGKRCYGFDLSAIDVQQETQGKISLKWLLKAYQLFPEKEQFFLASGNFFNKLAGNNVLQQQLKDGKTEEEIRKSWEPALSDFKNIRKKYLLYAE